MTDEGLFYTEVFTEDYVRKFKVEKIFFKGRTKYQYVQCFSNALFGKVLFLDRKIQSAQVDEYVYHESLVHPAMMTHPKPQRILVLGGGEGATLREVYRHSTVESITMVDIDEELVGICRKHLPEWSDGAYEDTRTRLVIGDARQFVEETQDKFDVIISDLTEPLEESPSVYLFTKEFYEKINKILYDNGVFVMQAGSTDPTYHEFFTSCAKTLGSVFPIVRPYWTFVFSFGGPWGFVVASKKEDPLDLEKNDLKERTDSRRIKGLKFYHDGLHKGFFALPGYLVKDQEKGRVLTDREPFIWE
ncbi:MAG: polyamine aminopropyltransferase [Candidatus Aminicenantes bacterium]|nr:polyamine aminopropyltransferase [Candidatus Aminicenantes bacterium]